MPAPKKYIDIMKAAIGNTRPLKTKSDNYFVENTMTNYSNYHNFYFITTNTLSSHCYAVTQKLKYLVKISILI